MHGKAQCDDHPAVQKLSEIGLKEWCFWAAKFFGDIFLWVGMN